MKTRKKFTTKIESLDACEDEDKDEGFIEADVDFGKPIAVFNFGGNVTEPQPALNKPAAAKSKK